MVANLTRDLYLEQEDDVRIYSDAFDRLRALALPFDESRQVLADLVKELE